MHVPVDVPVDGVEGVVAPDEELAIAGGAELGAAAAAGAAAIEGVAAAAGSARGAADGALDPEAPEAAIEGLEPALLDPDDPDPDDPDAEAGEDDPAADAPELELDADPDDPHFEPVGAVSVPLPNLSTEAPGSGNCTSAESTVAQSLVGMLALNISGKAGVARSESSGMPRVSSRVAALFFDPPLTFTDAQFMYISRFPILLNQVQANVYDPGVIPSGIV